MHGSGAYLDPLGEPRAYFALLPARLAVFADSALFGIPSELSAFAPRAIPILAALGVAAVARIRRAAASGAPHTRRRRRADILVVARRGTARDAARRSGQYPGIAFSFLPNIAICAALALVLLPRFPREARARRTGGVAGPGWGCAVRSRPPGARPALVRVQRSANSPGRVTRRFGQRVARAEIPVRADVNVIGIGLSDPLIYGMYLSIRVVDRPAPRATDRASSTCSRCPRTIIACADSTTERWKLRSSTARCSMARSRTSCARRIVPLHAGDTVPLGAWSVRVLADTAGRPHVLHLLTLDRSVDDPSIALLIWRNGALRALPAPHIRGQSRARVTRARSDGHFELYAPISVRSSDAKRTRKSGARRGFRDAFRVYPGVVHAHARIAFRGSLSFARPLGTPAREKLVRDRKCPDTSSTQLGVVEETASHGATDAEAIFQPGDRAIFSCVIGSTKVSCARMWGATASAEVAPHVEKERLHAREPNFTRSPAFPRALWRSLPPRASSLQATKLAGNRARRSTELAHPLLSSREGLRPPARRRLVLGLARASTSANGQARASCSPCQRAAAAVAAARS